MSSKIGGPITHRPIVSTPSMQTTALPQTSLPGVSSSIAPGLVSQFNAQTIQARQPNQFLQALLGSPYAFRIFSSVGQLGGQLVGQTTTPGTGPSTTPQPPAPAGPAPTTPTQPPAPPLHDTVNRNQRKRAEQWLKQVGFQPGHVDGKMTPNSRRAVEAFQKSMGLDANGYLDRKTYQKLNAVSRRTRKFKGKVFGPGQKSKQVKKMQQNLRSLGYTVGKADGIYDQQLAKAVTAFKKDQSNVRGRSGTMNPNAQRALQVEARRIQHAPERRRVKPSRTRRVMDQRVTKAAARQYRDGSQGIGAGSKGPSVKYVQQHLQAAGFDPKSTKGRFDERTEGMVKQFQKRSGLPVNGRVDARTWKRLQRTTLEATSGTSPAQQVGERSGAVKRSETLLKKLGFNPGKTDGLYSKQTQQALETFRKKHKLKGRGKGITTNTLHAMQRIYKKQHSGAAILKIAQSQDGVREDAGANEDRAGRIRGFRNAVTAPGYAKNRGPEAWCADFVSWVYKKAGNPIGPKGEGFAYVPYMKSWLQNTGQWQGSGGKPKAGDIVIFNWDGGVPDHVGIVRSVNKDGTVNTIEGNAPDGVRYHRRSRSDIEGFGHVKRK